eukprot:scaffold824_cov327-Pavlova_lutheri.AAC.6
MAWDAAAGYRFPRTVWTTSNPSSGTSHTYTRAGCTAFPVLHATRVPQHVGMDDQNHFSRVA